MFRACCPNRNFPKKIVPKVAADVLKECSHDVMMLGTQESEPQLFHYAVNLEKRVRANHPLRQIKAAMDFSFVREEVAHCYGRNGNEAVPPEAILKMMFLLFFDYIKSERELMEVIGERLDYLWFLDYGLDDKVPDHSVLSKARARWGKQVFESLFVRTVSQCVDAGLVNGSKLHVDASLIEADASRDSVIKSSPELIAALKRAYRATESKLEISTTPESYQSVNDRMMSQSDPDAACVRKGGAESRPRYHHHRAVDDYKGVITAVQTTPGSIAENKKLLDLIDQHEKNTRCQVRTVVADCKYGTNENYVACHEWGIETHMREVTRHAANTGRKEGIFGDDAFRYDPARNVYCCPAGQILKPRRVHPIRRTLEYKASAKICGGCALRAQCTRSAHGRTVQRHEKQEALNKARAQANSQVARRDRKRRQHLMEKKFCRCHQQPSLQTRSLATTLATANPGLLDRPNPERAHPARASKSQAQRGDGGSSVIGLHPQSVCSEFPAWSDCAQAWRQ
jgi:transposase